MSGGLRERIKAYKHVNGQMKTPIEILLTHDGKGIEAKKVALLELLDQCPECAVRDGWGGTFEFFKD
jgi:hypothetical protein